MNTILVIPCFNEAARLNPASFVFHHGIHYLFVNDGSEDNTLEILQSMKGPHVSVLDLDHNHGKAEAVRLGVLEALSINSTSDWIGFWDADLATPLTQFHYMMNFLKINEKPYSAIFGSRVQRLGADIKRNYFRHIIGRVFVTYTSFLLNIQTYDSQCGAKVFKPEIINKIFNESFTSKWFFDLEIIQRMNLLELSILECPLQEWHDIEGSKIKPLKDGLKAFFEVLKIRKRYAKKNK